MAWTITFTCPDGSVTVLDFVASAKVGKVASRLQNELNLPELPHLFVAGHLISSHQQLTVKQVGSNSWDVVPFGQWNSGSNSLRVSAGTHGSITFNFMDGSTVNMQFPGSTTAGFIATVLKLELGLVRIPMLSADGRILDNHDPAVTVKTVGNTSWDVVVPQHQGLSRWRDHEVQWKRVDLEYSGTKGRPFGCWAPAIGMAVPVGRDRLFISPGSVQCWHSEVFPSIAADDFWLVGVNEVSAALDPRPQPEPPYLGVRRVAVPLELAGAQILFHAFDGSTLVAVLDDKDAAGECSLCKFYASGAQEDLLEFALVPDGEGLKRVPFESGYLHQLRDAFSHLRKLPFQAIVLPKIEIATETAASRYLASQIEDTTFVVYDRDGVEHGRFVTKDNFEGVETLWSDSELMLLPGELCGGGAFHGDMRLYDWRKGQLVKNIRLQSPGPMVLQGGNLVPSVAGPGWLEGDEKQEGLLEDTQTYYRVSRDWSGTVVLHLCTPVQNEGS